MKTRQSIAGHLSIGPLLPKYQSRPAIWLCRLAGSYQDGRLLEGE